MKVGFWLSAAALVTLVLFQDVVHAEERSLTGAEIKSALAGKSVKGERRGTPWTQSFGKGGATTYFSEGRPSPGRWRVDGDRYCSQWPPASRWDCYTMTGDLTASPPTVTWIDSGGNRWPGTIVDDG